MMPGSAGSGSSSSGPPKYHMLYTSPEVSTDLIILEGHGLDVILGMS
jgi:hypothetical protein